MKIVSVQFEKRCVHPEDFPAPMLPEVAFAGRSNVGKSSLINRLVHVQGLAKVSSSPGKTRAIDFFLVNQAFRLVDLPGYGFARVPESVKREWQYLIEAYLERRRDRVVVVWILDIRRDLSELDRILQQWLGAYSIRCIPVLTKSDKLSRSQQKFRASSLFEAIRPAGDPVVFSAKSGLGKNELWQRIRTALG